MTTTGTELREFAASFTYPRTSERRLLLRAASQLDELDGLRARADREIAHAAQAAEIALKLTGLLRNSAEDLSDVVGGFTAAAASGQVPPPEIVLSARRVLLFWRSVHARSHQFEKAVRAAL